MFSLLGNRNCECPEIGLEVNLNQSQEECRRSHGCVRTHCPLKYDFTPVTLDIILADARVRSTNPV